MAQSVVKTTFSAGLALAVLLPTPESASADVVKLADRPALTGVDVTDFVDGAIRFRGAANLQIIRPLAEVDWLDLEQSPAFSDAELARVAGEMATALEGYLAVTERPPAPWVGRLAQTRVIQLSDDAGRFDAAVALYVEMLLSSPEADVSIRPRRPGPGGGDLNRRARQTLLTALEGRPKPRTADALRSLLLEIGLVDGLKNPLDFVTESETAPAKPGADLPALFGPERRSAAVSKAAVYLPTNSMIWSLASERVTAGDGTGALQLLDAAREWTRPSDKETARL
ncbi:MAG: hypothetical protein KDA32_12015, partial [Phycisphaerales bacterium]|nr:hypothetical protein [Phycisphaerales bacterium]